MMRDVVGHHSSSSANPTAGQAEAACDPRMALDCEVWQIENVARDREGAGRCLEVDVVLTGARTRTLGHMDAAVRQSSQGVMTVVEQTSEASQRTAVVALATAGAVERNLEIEERSDSRTIASETV